MKSIQPGVIVEVQQHQYQPEQNQPSKLQATQSSKVNSHL
jgi:hypothetical protein